MTRHYTRPGVIGMIAHARQWTARPWKGGEDAEMQWCDLAYPSEDEDEEEAV